MTIHKEGRTILWTTLLILVILNGSILSFWNIHWSWPTVPSVVLFLLILQFFRKPNRPVERENKDVIYAPADGKVVVIERSQHPEVTGGECVQISIFMSPLNVHINWAPVRAKILKHHHYEGKYLMAWNPKSSEENEQCSSLWQTPDGQTFVLKQIAGFMARRIIPCISAGQSVEQGEEIGFIRFGSRVDLLLPANVELKINRGDSVRGKRTIVGVFVS